MSVAPVTLSVDVVCFSLDRQSLRVLLVRRASEPFKGEWALPGGVVLEREPLDEAARRVFELRTGISDAYLEQLYTFGDPDRDPRSRTISVSYYALLPFGRHPVASGEDVLEAAWVLVGDVPDRLAFDHDLIVDYARQRLAQKIDYTPLAFRVMRDAFTMAELRGVYEIVLGEKLNASNFAKMIRGRWPVVPVKGSTVAPPTGRPAQLFRYVGEMEIPGPPKKREGHG